MSWASCFRAQPADGDYDVPRPESMEQWENCSLALGVDMIFLLLGSAISVTCLAVKAWHPTAPDRRNEINP